MILNIQKQALGCDSMVTIHKALVCFVRNVRVRFDQMKTSQHLIK